MKRWILRLATMSVLAVSCCSAARAQGTPAAAPEQAPESGPKQAITVAILGQVAEPGRYELKGRDGLLQLIIAAGNIAPGADWTRIVIHRAGADIEVDFEAFLRRADTPPILLREGDIVMVPRRPSRIYIGGAVTRPGRYELKETQGLADLLALAGGASPAAVLSKVEIRRGQQKFTVDAGPALAAKDAAPIALPIALRDGDFVLVPRTYKFVSVIGEVKGPSTLEIPDGKSLTVAQALALAGGARVAAGQAEILIMRPDAQGKLETIERYALPEDPADPRLNRVLQEHDVVFVYKPRSTSPLPLPRQKPRQKPIPTLPTAQIWLLQR